MTLLFSFSGRMKTNPTCLTLLLLCLAAMPGFCSDSRNKDYGFIEVTGSDVRLPVADASRMFGPGNSVPLLQENPEFYIVALPDGITAAVGKLDRKGNPIAWVTQQKQLIFGDRARAVSGFLRLRPGDEFRILQETPDARIIEYTFFQNRAELSIPKALPAGLAYNPPEPEPAAEEPQPEPVRAVEAKLPEPPVVRPVPRPRPVPAPVSVARARPADSTPIEVPVKEVKTPAAPPQPVLVAPEPEAPVIPEPAPAAPPTVQPAPAPAAATEPPEIAAREAAPSADPDLPAATPEIPSGISEPEPLLAEQPAPPEESEAAGPAAETEVSADVATAAGEIETTESAPAEPPPAAAPAGTVVRFLDKYMISSYILLVIVIIEGLFIVRLRRQGRTVPAAAGGEDAVVLLPQLDTSRFRKYFQSLRTSTGQNSGPFGEFSTYDLVYYLHTEKETGGLELEQRKGMVSAEMFFSNGEIVHAFVGNKVDDEAVLEILCMPCEVFTYTHLPVIIEQHTIHNPTVNFLIAAAPAAAAPADTSVEAPASESGDEGETVQEPAEDAAKTLLEGLLEEKDGKTDSTPGDGEETDPEWDEIMKSLKVLDDLNDKPE